MQLLEKGHTSLIKGFLKEIRKDFMMHILFGTKMNKGLNLALIQFHPLRKRLKKVILILCQENRHRFFYRAFAW